MMNSLDTTVDQAALQEACDGLKASVSWYITKHKKKSRLSELELREEIKNANHAVEHACFALKQLSLKRCSFWNGILALKHYWNSDYLRALERQEVHDTNDTSRLIAILSRFFQNYIRLRDGSVLMVTGECRHVGDVPLQKYPSKLSTMSSQSDGYTHLYSAPRGYTGFGWDEFFQEAVGIRTRILNALYTIRSGRRNNSQGRQSNIWDSLLDHGAQSFELCLDQHEASVGRANSELNNLRAAFRSDVLRILNLKHTTGCTVEMVTLDKAERLTISIPNKKEIQLARLADNFQVTHKGGVLPNGWNIQSKWNRAMALPMVKNKINETTATRDSKVSESSTLGADKEKQNVARKKRRIIDSDDSEDEECPPAQSESAGLRVRVDERKQASPKEVSSLNQIKTGLGVNAEDLQASRQIAETEEKDEIEANEELTEGAIELLGEIKAARIQAKGLRRVLSRILNKADQDAVEIWDARESLRESVMTLGNFLLSLQATLHEKDPVKIEGVHLVEAEKLFREAVDLVEQQQATHQEQYFDTESRANLSREESCMIRRNLLLLGGRAHTNLGISLVERGLLMGKKTSIMNQGMRELKLAQESSRELKERAIKDGTDYGSSRVDIASDITCADQLFCLATRWLGNALWRQGRRKDAQTTFESVTALFISTDIKAPTMEEVLEDRVALGVECYYAATTFSDLALQSLEQIPTSKYADGESKASECDDLFDCACQGFELAKTISSKINAMTQQSAFEFQALKQEHDLMSADDISNHVKGLKNWWTERKSNVTSNGSAISLRSDGPSLPRNDLFSEGPDHPNVPKRGFVVTGDSWRRSSNKRRRAGGYGGTSGRSNTTSSKIFNASEEVVDFGTMTGFHSDEQAGTVIQFRKWGDDLLPKVPGANENNLFYPAIAPERPSMDIVSS